MGQFGYRRTTGNGSPGASAWAIVAHYMHAVVRMLDSQDIMKSEC